MPRVDSTQIAWAGSVHSHPDDLQATGSAIAQVTDPSEPFHVVGDAMGAREALGLSYNPTDTGPLDPLKRWPEEMNTIGIGIAPLANSAFNDSKSWLKPLEYAALGVPCVMSPSVEYLRIHSLGIGVLARKHKQWINRLRELRGSKLLRDELSERGRAVAAEWTVEGNAERWWQAWDTARVVNAKLTDL